MMLEQVWFLIIAGLLGVYVVLDGFDIGAGILHLRVAKNNEEREAVLRSIGPLWDGNEVWLLVVGGSLVFAFPALYARGFSGFYLPLIIVLWLLLFRALGIEMRHQLEHRLWQQFWDAAFFGASFLLAILFGAAIGNVVRGVDMDAQGHFFAPLWTDFSVGPHPGILDWYTLLTALVAACALAQHGALWLRMRVRGEVGQRSQTIVARLWPAVLVLAVLTTVGTFLVQPQMRHNLGAYPLGWVAPTFSVAGLLGVRLFASKERWRAAFCSSAVFLFGMLFSAAFAIYPYVLPARDATMGLTLQEAASHPYGLRVALYWFVPGILMAMGYSAYIYRTFSLTMGLAVSLTLLGCQGKDQGPAPAPPEVVVATAAAMTFTEWDEYPGRVAPVESVEIRARVGGYLQSVNFRDGARVEKGTVLFVIDPRPYRATLKAAEAEMAQAKAQVETSALLLQRVQAIKESGAVSQDTLDTRLQDKLTAEADLQSARAAVDTARLDMAWTQVRAPFSGRVSRRLVHPGDLVEGSTSGSTLLTTLVSENPVHFYFTVDEESAVRYARLWANTEGGKVEPIPARLIDESGIEHEGQIDFIDNRIDERSGTRELRAVFPNDDGSLIPGMFGTVRIPHGDAYEALFIPDRAIMADQLIQFVLVVGDENLVERRTVELGPVIDGQRLIRSGLNPGDRVIIEGTQRARPGAPVTPTEEAPSDAAGEPGASQ